MPKIKITLANLSDYALKKHGDKIASYFEEPLDYPFVKGDKITYREGHRISNMAANAFKSKLGLKKGDRVATALYNSQEFATILFGAAKIGAIIVPLNYMLKAEEIKYIINDCEAKILAVERETFEQNIKSKENIPGVEHWIMTGPKKNVLPGFIALEDLLEDCSDELEPEPMGDNDPISIFYTSGTTGFPKGAVMTNKASLYLANLAIAKIIAALLMTFNRNAFGLLALPTAHIYGFTGIIVGLIGGVPGLLMKKFDPVKALEYIEKYKVTVFAGVPAMYKMMLSSHLEKYDLSSVKYWVSAADHLPEEHRRTLEKISGKVIEGYGLVEGNALTAINLPYLRKSGSAGRRAFGVKLRVVGEDGNKLPRGKVGELVMKAPSMMKEYWKDSNKTKNTIKNGWLYTGDRVRMDRLGFIWFESREKDMIKCGGYSLFPREIEEEVLKHPKVIEAAVFGIPHEVKGEVPMAVVCLKEGAKATPEEILSWCHENIAAYKSPRRVEIIASEDMPRTISYKIIKRVLKERYAKKND